MKSVEPGGANYRRVVVGVDDSVGGLAALQRAVDMARVGHSPLVAVRSWGLRVPRHGGRRHRHVGDEHGRVVLFYDEHGLRHQSARLVRHAFRNATGGVPRDVAVTIATPEGDPGRVLTEFAADDGDVLVVGTEHDQAMKRLVHGSVSHYCWEHAHCPVVVVPAPEAAD